MFNQIQQPEGNKSTWLMTNVGLYRASETDVGQCEGKGYSMEVIYTSSDQDHDSKR